MGRRSTGLWTINSALRITLSQMVKCGLIRQDYKIGATWTWDIGQGKKATIGLEAAYTRSERYVRLRYTITRNGEPMDMDYKAGLLERPSNLGVGKVLFLQCPVLHRPCRKLYLAYDSPIFKCREAYQNRLYYPVQLSGKLSRHNDRYWHFQHQIEEMEKARATYTYNGKTTRRAERLQRLYDKQHEADWLRWQPESYPHSLRKEMFLLLDQKEQ